MAKNNNIKDNQHVELSFADAMKDVTPITQDKIHFQRAHSKENKHLDKNKFSANRINSTKETNPTFFFSEQYEPIINSDTTLSYVRNGYPSYYAKLLRKGSLPPDIILDLHGYNKEQAKKDIACLIDECIARHLPCACIIHGVSGGVLKTKVPHYLVQHPSVLAFHQAPLEWGGKGALLLLIDIGEELENTLSI